MRYRYLVLLITVVLIAPAEAQIGGEATYQFLNLVTGTKQAALGGRVLTVVDYDPTTALYNPATINAKMDNQLQVNYANYLGDVNYGTASYAYTWDRRTQTFHAGVTYLDYGKFNGFDEQGNATGEFGGNEVAVSVGYAYNIPWSDFYVGANVKLISSKLESFTSLGGAVDLGLLYYDEEKAMRGALVVRNLGTQFTAYNEIYESLPLEIALGFSNTMRTLPVRLHVTLENLQKWNIAFSNEANAQRDLDGNVVSEEPGFFNNALRHTVLGVEIFPESAFELRLGYSFRRAEELRIQDTRAFSGLSAGFSLKVNKMRFSYSHARYTLASHTSFLGVNINLQ
ncbi:type IX secretion system protein PorQ [Nonlabens marinus]|uniref:Low affinity penicillin binding protein n=1 Tax=Nonlabens marinus S1-08 TaxID=1454201 RepID=W8VWS8_9FLAO|nr:type IX secretion system protein PorQ [Nonlabens marinus]BAO56593.1 low affinity penicillin binding protein [Nonlabens marinus S1-08]